MQGAAAFYGHATKCWWKCLCVRITSYKTQHSKRVTNKHVLRVLSIWFAYASKMAYTAQRLSATQQQRLYDIRYYWNEEKKHTLPTHDLCFQCRCVVAICNIYAFIMILLLLSILLDIEEVDFSSAVTYWSLCTARLCRLIDHQHKGREEHLSAMTHSVQQIWIYVYSQMADACMLFL